MTACVMYETADSVCVHCPEIPAIPPTPPSVTYENMSGWVGFAHSGVSLDGDVYTEFTVPLSVGVVVGLDSRTDYLDPAECPVAFYIHQDAGRFVCAVTVFGEMVTQPVAVVPNSTLFRIERRGELMLMYIDNSFRFSAPAMRGPLACNAFLYYYRDGVN